MKLKSFFISTIAIGIFVYSIWSFINRYSKNENIKWTEKQIQIVIQKSINSSKYFSTIDKEYAYPIFRCLVDSISKTYSYDEITNLGVHDPDSLEALLLPITEDCMTPYIDSIRINEKMNECLDTFIEKFGEEKAVQFCDCFVPYIIEKYGYENLHKTDSIIRLEKEKIIECADIDK